jgi:autotransporter-associated beta strand protein
MRSSTRVKLAAASGIVLSALVSSTPASAATLYWSADGENHGGAGQWNTTGAGTGRWGLSPSGPFDIVWDNTANANDTAVFGGATGNVSVSGEITLNKVRFDATQSVSLTGGNGTLTTANRLIFTGDNAGFHSVNSTGTTSSFNTIHVEMNGTVTKTGPGVIQFGTNAAAPTTHKYIVNEGVFVAGGNGARFGSAPAAYVPDYFTFNGAGLSAGSTALTIGATRGITLGPGGMSVSMTGSGITMTLSSPIIGTEGGDLVLRANSGPFAGNGAVTTAPDVILNSTANSWDGGLTILNGSLRVGASGVIPDTAPVSVTGNGIGSAGALRIQTFDETIGSLSGTGRVNIGTGGILRIGAANNLLPTTHTGIIEGTGSVEKVGTGVQAIGGATASTYTGTTTVTGGTLVRNGTHTGAGNYTVAAGATLAGSGTISFASDNNFLMVFGTLAPGNSIGTLSALVGDVGLAGIADFEIDLDGNTSDKLIVGDLLIYGGTLNVIFTGTAPVAGGSYDLFDFFDATGEFAAINFTGGTFDPSQTVSFNHVTGVVTVTAVPEPGALALLGIGALGLLARRRKA